MPSLTGAVARAEDLEDDAMMEEACRITSIIGVHPALNNYDNDMRQLVCLRTNKIVGPDPPPPASPLPPLRLPFAVATTMVSDAHCLNGNIAMHAGQYQRAQPPGKVIRECNPCRIPVPTPEGVKGVGIVYIQLIKVIVVSVCAHRCVAAIVVGVVASLLLP